MKLEDIIIHIDKKIDGQHDKIDSKLDNILKALHKQDIKIQKNEFQLGIINKILAGVGTIVISVGLYIFKGN